MRKPDERQTKSQITQTICYHANLNRINEWLDNNPDWKIRMANTPICDIIVLVYYAMNRNNMRVAADALKLNYNTYYRRFQNARKNVQLI